MTERWENAEQIAAARARFIAAIPGWVQPHAFAVGRRSGGDVEFARIGTAAHRLPAVVLATVCGHSGGSASYLLDVAAFDRAIALIAPAERTPARSTRTCGRGAGSAPTWPTTTWW